MVQYILVPGAVTAGTNIVLPAGAPKFASLVRAKNIDVGRYSSATDVNPTSLTVITTGTPAAGQIKLVDSSTIVLGDNTLASTVLLLEGVGVGERVPVE